MNSTKKLLSRTGLTGATLALALGAATSAQAEVVVAWTFDNATLGTVSNIAASTRDDGVSSAGFNTVNNGVAVWGGSAGNVAVTRFFNSTTTLPSMSFSLTEAYDNLTLSFTTYHNHNPRFPTAPQYKYAVQLNDGNGWTSLVSDLIASPQTNGTDVTFSLGRDLGPGTYGIRWIGYGYAFGDNSGTEYFALDNVTLRSNVPEPASLALVGLALAGVAAVRRQRR